MTEQEMYEYIEVTPFRGSDPVFRATEITVEHIIDDFAKGMNTEEILSKHKELNKHHIQACFVYMKVKLIEIKDFRLYAITGILPFWRSLFPFRRN